MRYIVLDTETTGLEPEDGHRITEIGCVELINHVPTGRTFQQYVNPEREVSETALEISGLSNDFLKDFPLMKDVIGPFLAFIGEDALVIHNAKFDMKFLNAELTWANYPLLAKNTIIDTLELARQKFPGAPASLDALCKRFHIDNSKRIKHGALLDAEILAEVYIELIGGRQNSFFGSSGQAKKTHFTQPTARRRDTAINRDFKATETELSLHNTFIKKEIKDPLWRA